MTSRARWLGNYDPGVPPSLAPYPSRTLLDYVADAAREHPDSPAVSFKGAMLTYAALERLSDTCAAAFAGLGVRRGDRIALLLPNWPRSATSARAGSPTMPVASPTCSARSDGRSGPRAVRLPE